MWYETLMPEDLRRKMVTICRCKSDELPRLFLHRKWIDEKGSAYIKIEGRMFTLRREPCDGFIETKRYTKELADWLSNLSTRRVRSSLFFNERLEIRALTMDEYEADLKLEDVSLMRNRNYRSEEQGDQKKEIRRGKKTRYDWTQLGKYLKENMTIDDIAKKIGCTQAAVRHQMKKRSK